MNIKCIETKRIKDPQPLAQAIYNNFIYLKQYPELQHNVSSIIQALNADNTMCYLLYHDNKLIGYLIGDFRTLPDNRYGYYISYFYISDSYRNKKLGSQLLNKLIKKCKDNGTKFIVLTCDSRDYKAVNFYEKHGFSIDPSLGGKKIHQVYSLFIA